MINYVTGDATQPQGPGNLKILTHVCNDIGRWGSGFVVALSERWMLPEHDYHYWYRDSTQRKMLTPFEVGNVQPVRVEDDTVVMNMIAQNGVRSRRNPQPINYDALEECLSKVYQYCVQELPRNPTVHMPRIGCGLAGGKWEEVEPLITATLVEAHFSIPVTVYDLP